jgi:hypothetical protein
VRVLSGGDVDMDDEESTPTGISSLLSGTTADSKEHKVVKKKRKMKPSLATAHVSTLFSKWAHAKKEVEEEEELEVRRRACTHMHMHTPRPRM